MRGKRSKQYRKLMQQYAISFGFREPFQVLVDAEIIQDASRFKMDLVAGLERTLQGKVKPMITQCSMRHLYAADPRVPNLIDQARTYERRRCNHHTMDQPLNTLECLQSVVDPKGSKANKHRYVVASQDGNVRSLMRSVAGVPLVYINRSVMIMEPMTSATEDIRAKEERRKFWAGLKGKRGESGLLKRKRQDEDGSANPTGIGPDIAERGTTSTPKKRGTRGPKRPNPLSVKKPKRIAELDQASKAMSNAMDRSEPTTSSLNDPVDVTLDKDGESIPVVKKKKRRRKHKSQNDGGLSEASAKDSIAANY